MKRALLAILLIVSSACGVGPHLGYYPAFPEDGESGAAIIFKIREKADREIWYGQNRDFDIGLGKVTDGVRTPIYQTFDEIKGVLKQEKNKDLVVVWFEKILMGSEKSIIAYRAKEVTKQMQEVGFKRIVILGASSSGVHYVSDTKLKENRAEQFVDDNPS